jgi:hypothetical protein
MRSLAFAPFLALLCCVSGCDSSGDGWLPTSLFEGEAGEAAVRHVMNTVPDPSPGVPKSWSVVFGEIHRSGVFEPASVPFLERLQDGGRRVISASVLETTPPGNIIIDPEHRVAVYMIQLRGLRQRASGLWEAECAWSYKSHFQRLRLELNEGSDGKLTAQTVEVTDGNWPPSPDATEEKQAAAESAKP